MWILVFLGSFLVPSVLGQSCNYVKQVGATPLKISSADYPKNYRSGTQCSWTTSAFSDYQLKLTCSDVNIPSGYISGFTGGLTGKCSLEYIEVSRTGNPDYTDGVKYCGSDSFTVTSVTDKINIRLVSRSSSSRGKFSCSLQRILNPSQCGRRNNPEDYDGIETSVNEYSMMSGLVHYKTRFKNIICGATIISSRTAITTKSCIFDWSLDEIGLLVGEDYVTKKTNYTALYPIKSAKCYNGCNEPIRNLTEADIGLVMTRTDIDFNPGVSFACLPVKYRTRTFSGNIADATGWGLLEFAGSKATKLQKVNLNVITLDNCKKSYAYVTNEQICTYSPMKISCQLDSPGSLLYTGPENKVYIIGVLGAYFGCTTEEVELSTRITSVMDWIMKNTPEIEFSNI